MNVELSISVAGASRGVHSDIPVPKNILFGVITMMFQNGTKNLEYLVKQRNLCCILP